VPKLTAMTGKFRRIHQQTKLTIQSHSTTTRKQNALDKETPIIPKKTLPVAVADKHLSRKTIKELHVVIKLLLMPDLNDRTILFHLQSKQ